MLALRFDTDVLLDLAVFFFLLLICYILACIAVFS